MKTGCEVVTRFGALVYERTGLCFEEEKRSDLCRAAKATAGELGMDAAETCMEFFLSGEAGQDHWDVLWAHLTVGESYFFRDPGLFEHIRTVLIPEILKRKKGETRTVKIWSAGCACGQEPYSLAILFDRTPVSPQPHSVQIHASDINPRFLSQAEKGVYREWSLRGMDETTRRRYFSVKPGNLFVLSPRILSKVRFSRINLVDDADFVRHIAPGSIDIVLCRNVLMYFSAASRREVLKNLSNALVPGGYLLSSASETGALAHPDLTHSRRDGFVYFVKRAGKGRSVSEKASDFRVSVENSALRGHGGRMKPEACLAKKVSPKRTVLGAGDAKAEDRRPRPDKTGILKSARELLNEGKFLSCLELLAPYMGTGRGGFDGDCAMAEASAIMAEAEASLGRCQSAIAHCRKAVELDKFNPGHRYLLSGIFQETGDLSEAEKSLKETLYLNPFHVLAFISLGRIAEEKGSPAEAEKYFDKAARVAGKLPPEFVVPDSGGMTASDILGSLEELRPVRLVRGAPSNPRTKAQRH